MAYCLDNMDLNSRPSLYFQLDGTAIHQTVEIKQYLNQIFKNNVIGGGSEHYWPSQSPDLTPFEFLSWRYLKQNVIFTWPNVETVVFLRPYNIKGFVRIILNLKHLRSDLSIIPGRKSSEDVGCGSKRNPGEINLVIEKVIQCFLLSQSNVVQTFGLNTDQYVKRNAGSTVLLNNIT